MRARVRVRVRLGLQLGLGFVPHDQVGALDAAVGGGPYGQAVALGVLVGEVSARKALGWAVGSDPQVALQEGGAAQVGRLGPR